MEDLEAYPLKPNPTATSRATSVVYQLETMMPTLRCQAGKRALVHFVRPAVRSCSSAAAITAAEGLGKRPSSIFRRHRCAQHCRCSIAMVREPNTLPHAGHCSSLTKSLAIALCPWARDLWACLAFSLVKTRTHSCGHSGHNSTPAGRSATWDGVSRQLDSYV